jgi:hypothetical protein
MTVLEKIANGVADINIWEIAIEAILAWKKRDFDTYSDLVQELAKAVGMDEAINMIGETSTKH